MRWSIIAFLIVAAIGLYVINSKNTAAQVPPKPEQPSSDIFQVAGFGSLQPYNPITNKAKTQRTATYRLITMPGCTTGTIPSDIARMEEEARGKIDFNLVRNDSNYDFTVRINCGSEQIRICGAVTIFCLGRGFPYNIDVEISDILSSYQVDTRLSIPLHEIIGHAMGTWNEQYCKGTENTGPCKGLAQFTSAPGWRDFMNTGPLSRHGIEVIEFERWERTMYVVFQEVSCDGDFDQYGNRWNSCLQRWVNPEGWTYDPITRIWYQPNGVAEWGECNLRDQDCWHIPSSRWIFKGSVLFDPASGVFSSPPIP